MDLYCKKIYLPCARKMVSSSRLGTKIWSLWSLKQKGPHADKLVMDWTRNCQNENFVCSQWQRFHQNDDISESADLDNNCDVIMSAMASQIASVSMVCSTVCSGADQRKHQSSASLAFLRGIHRWPVNSPHKGTVMRKMFPFHDVFMCLTVTDVTDDTSVPPTPTATPPPHTHTSFPIESWQTDIGRFHYSDVRVMTSQITGILTACPKTLIHLIHLRSTLLAGRSAHTGQQCGKSFHVMLSSCGMVI